MKTQFLIKTYITKDGNIYYPGAYNASNPLPEEICHDPSYVKGAVDQFVASQKPEPVAEVKSVVENKSSFEPETKTPGLAGETIINKRVESTETEIKPQVSVLKVESLNINSASYEEIVALKGVGKSIANKIIEYREASPFVNYTDLTERVPLSFGNNWEKFELEFEG
jgi:DNA uptake protein ComE-like DNA-binding protein